MNITAFKNLDDFFDSISTSMGKSNVIFDNTVDRNT